MAKTHCQSESSLRVISKRLNTKAAARESAVLFLRPALQGYAGAAGHVNRACATHEQREALASPSCVLSASEA